MSTTGDDFTALQRENERLAIEIEQLRAQLQESQETLRAMRGGAVDALVISAPQGNGAFPLQDVEDIPERKQAEDALRRSEERLRLAQQSANVGIWDWNVQTGALDFTPELNRIYGLPPGTIKTYTDWRDRVHADDIGRVETGRSEAIARHDSFDLEFRGRHSSGEYRWISTKGGAIYDESGKATRIFGVNIDITERKRTEEALRQSENRYRTAFDTMTEGFCIIEVLFDAHTRPIDYRFLETNSAFEAQTGLHAAQGKLMRELAPNHEAHWFETYGEIALSGKPAHFVHEAKALGRCYEVSAYRVGGADSHKVAILFNDITARKKQEEDLRRLNRTLRALSSSNQAMIRASDEARYVREVCTIVVDCGHTMAWVGYARQDERRSVEAVAHAGMEEGYLRTSSISWADTEYGRGPTGTAIRTGVAVVCNNMLTDARLRPWREEAAKRGYAACISLPLLAEGRAFGALTIYSSQPAPFSAEEVALLSELAADLAHGIMAIRLREAHAQATEALRRRVEELQQLLDVVPAAVWVANDPQCLQIIGNRAGNEFYEARTGENVSASTVPEARRYFTHDGRELAADELPMQVAAATNRAVRDVELNVSLASGRRLTIVGSAVPLRDEKNEVRGCIGAFTDITARKRAEDALRFLAQCAAAPGRDFFQELARYLAESLGMDFVCIDTLHDDLLAARTLAVYFDGKFEDNVSYTLKDTPCGDVVGKSICCFPQGVRHRFQKDVVLQDMMAESYIGSTLWSSQGRPIGLIAVIGRKPLADTTLATSILQLVAVRAAGELEHRQAEEALAAAKSAAESASKAKDHFLAVLSHELRNPLNPVLATVAMLRGDPRFDADTREQLEVIRRNVELEARLIDDLLDVTRIERGKVELDRRPIELGTVIQRAVEVCQPDIEARQLQFCVDIPDGPYLVDADAARLQQVFWNLLKNAIKFTPRGGDVGIRCRRKGEGLVVAEVTDSGVGLEADALDRIFNAFEQAERSITRRFGGLGLGLAISKAMVDMHGGHIVAHSPGKGQGATFTVTLPLLPAEAAVTAPPPQGQTPRRNVPIRRLRILLVEDHGDTARVMKRLLSADGHEVQTAADVATALRLAGEQTFDLMLSDLGLPDGSGLDLMRALRAKGITVPGIALSGYGQENDMQQSREAGFVAHQTKPVNLPRLQEAMAMVVANGVHIAAAE